MTPKIGVRRSFPGILKPIPGLRVDPRGPGGSSAPPPPSQEGGGTDLKKKQGPEGGEIIGEGKGKTRGRRNVEVNEEKGGGTAQRPGGNSGSDRPEDMSCARGFLK